MIDQAERDARASAEARVRAVMDRAIQLWGPMPYPTVLWRNAGGTAGQAWCRDWEIHLSPHYLMLVGIEKYNETIIHEVAHLVAYRVFKAKGHDGMWVATNRALGGREGRCHSYETAGAPRQSVQRARYLRALDTL